MSEPLNIYQALAAVNRGIDAIGKTQKNQQQGFNYRGVDDAYNALHGLLARHGVVTLPRVVESESTERTTQRGGVLFVIKMLVEYTFLAEDGSSVVVGPVLGEAMDSGDKAANKALAVAHKYALFQTFTIPTLFSDPDAETHEVAPMAKLATDKQLATLRDYYDGGAMTEAQESYFLKKQDELTESDATRFVAAIRERLAA